jgi:hypothetical protein
MSQMPNVPVVFSAPGPWTLELQHVFGPERVRYSVELLASVKLGLRYHCTEVGMSVHRVAKNQNRTCSSLQSLGMEIPP